MPSEPATGNTRRRHGAPLTGYSRMPIRSVSRMKATTASPGRRPITSDSTRKTWLSRCRNAVVRSKRGVLHHDRAVCWVFLSCAAGEFFLLGYVTQLALRDVTACGDVLGWPLAAR